MVSRLRAHPGCWRCSRGTSRRPSAREADVAAATPRVLPHLACRARTARHHVQQSCLKHKRAPRCPPLSTARQPGVEPGAQAREACARPPHHWRPSGEVRVAATRRRFFSADAHQRLPLSLSLPLRSEKKSLLNFIFQLSESVQGQIALVRYWFCKICWGLARVNHPSLSKTLWMATTRLRLPLNPMFVK